MAVAERAPRVWTLWKAARPSQVALILVVYALGAGVGLAVGRGESPTLASLVVGAAAILPVSVGIHYANEFADVETDRLTERTPFSGGSGALATTGIERWFLARASAASLTVATATTGIAYVVGPLSAAAVGLLAGIAVAGLAYSLPPVALVDRGLGEVTNALLGGVCLPLYGVAVVGPPTTRAALVLAPFPLLVGCNLLATHWPDRQADAQVGKRTLAVRWPSTRLRRVYWLLAAVAVGCSIALSVGPVPAVVVAGQALALPPLVWGGVVLTRRRSPLPAVAAMAVYAGPSACAWWYYYVALR